MCRARDYARVGRGRRPARRPAAAAGRRSPRRAGGPHRPPLRRPGRAAARRVPRRGGSRPWPGRRRQRREVPPTRQPGAASRRGGPLPRLDRPAGRARRPGGGGDHGHDRDDPGAGPRSAPDRRPRPAGALARASTRRDLPPFGGGALRPARRAARGAARRPAVGGVAVSDIVVPTSDDMRALGKGLAGLLRAGDLVVLTGGLGAGKTTLVQGIGAGLGVRGEVTSPTFVIARVHRGGRLPLVHADAYRLSSVDEVDDLDLDASLDDAVTVVEWGEGLVESLADDRLELRIARSADSEDDVRT